MANPLAPVKEIISAVPSPEVLRAYASVSPRIAETVAREYTNRNQRAFVYALVSLVIGGLIALALILGFVYLVMQGHPKAAAALLGSGALSMVAGFRSTRL